MNRTDLRHFYRERLKGQWGVVDVDDAIQCVVQLGTKGLLDSKRAALRGGSAGGYTALQAVSRVPDFFAVGTSFYGLSDLISLRPLYHKFEYGTLDYFMGCGPDSEENIRIWKDRSPLYQAANIKVPLLVSR